MHSDTIAAVNFHDKMAAQFDTKYSTSPAFRERFKHWTFLLTKYTKATDRVMDIGCGSGIFSSYLAVKQCAVTGIDGSAEMINLCIKRNEHSNATYSVQSLPFAEPITFARQDVVIASSVLEYIDDLPTMLDQVSHLVKSNGLFIVSMPNQRSFYRKLERIMFTLTGYPRYFLHIRHVSTEVNFARQLDALGFEVVETIYFSSYDPLSRWLKLYLPEHHVNSLFVSVYRKR